MIRGKTRKCPFGLPIPGGCMSAGGPSEEDETPAIFKMVSLENRSDEEQVKKIIEDNTEELMLISEPGRCPFADAILKESSSVDCKYDDQQAEMPAGNVGLNGSPMYPHIMIGNMPKAQYGYPISHYSDDNENTSTYYGIYSLIG